MSSETADRQREAAEQKPPRPIYGVGQIALHLVALTGLVIAQPIFSAYQNNPEIFVARSSAPTELIIFALAVAVVPPLAMTGIAALAGWYRPTWRMHVASFFVGTAVALFALQIAARIPAIPLFLSIGLAILVGVATARFYRRRAASGRYLRLLSPVPAIFVGLFLLTSPISALVVPQSENSIDGPILSSDAPVVFIVFDEMPEVSLLNADQQIDRLRYPNFAQLADDATWFRNAAAAAPYTTRSIPSLLSGELPDTNRLAIAADFPNNIFTLFAPSHELNVNEPVTDICPDSLCTPETRDAGSSRTELGELSRITYELYQRIVMPQLFNDVVLTVDDPFGHQDRINAEVSADQRQGFRDFVQQIDGTDGQFYFGHFFLPHAPFHYLPSGRSYNAESQAIPALDERGYWSGDPWHTFDNHQRHLLQVGALDALVGELIDHLAALNAYDKTMIVITSDHGVAHIPGQARRDVTEATLYDIGLVPLIVKAPQQLDGVVDDRLIQSVDVVPTLADLLGADRSWPGDGISFVENEGRAELYMRDQDNNDVRIDIEGDGRLEAVLRVVDRFGDGGGEQDLFAFGPFEDLVGLPVASLTPGRPVLEATIDDPSLYLFAYPDSGFVPAYVRGEVEGLTRLPVEPHLALALNGVIGAVVPVHDVDNDRAGFAGVINDSLFVDGPNELSILSLYSIDGKTVVNEVTTNIAPTFSLVAGAGTDVLESSSGDRYTVGPDAVLGFVDTADRPGGRMDFSGWAIDNETMSPVEAVVVFIDGRFVMSVIPSLERPGLAEDLGTEAVLLSGFAVSIPADVLGENPDEVKVYGVSRTGATELTIIESALEGLGLGD